MTAVHGRRRRRRRRAAADRAVHRDLGHLRQRRRARAERRTASSSRCGDTRPAWKVLRVLGNLLGLAGFAFETSEEVRDEALGDVATIAGAARRAARRSGRRRARQDSRRRPAALERIADVPIYADRSDRAPRAGAATHRRCAAARGRHRRSELCRRARHRRRRRRCACARAAAQAVLPARVDATLAAERGPRRGRASAHRRRSARCSATLERSTSSPLAIGGAATGVVALRRRHRELRRDQQLRQRPARRLLAGRLDA